MIVSREVQHGYPLGSSVLIPTLSIDRLQHRSDKFRHKNSHHQTYPQQVESYFDKEQLQLLQ